MLEPFGRNTAPAIALAAHAALQGHRRGCECGRSGAAGAAGRSRDPRRAGLSSGRCAPRSPAAEPGKLATFGIVASGPETGYGYIQRGAPRGAGVFASRASWRSPDLSVRSSSCSPGDYYWNSGMFMFRARRYLQELARFAPEMARICESAFRARSADLDFTRIDAATFERCPGRLDRLRRHGEDRGCRRRAAGCRLERCGLVVSAARGQRCGCARQRHARRCASARTRTAATCMPRAAWSPPSASRITWWWRPRMRCWWRPRIACRT